MRWHILAGLIAIIVSICTLLDWTLTDKENKPDAARLTLISWFARLDDFRFSQAVTAASSTFNTLFDSVYGKRPFSLRRVGTSILTSLISIGVSSYIYLGWRHQRPVFYDWGILFLPWFLVIDLTIDFASLNKTRIVLQKNRTL